MEQRPDGYDFRVVIYALQLSEPDRKEPGSDSVVEEKRLGMDAGVIQCVSDERRGKYRNTAQDSGLSAHGCGLGCWRHGQLSVKYSVMVPR